MSNSVNYNTTSHWSQHTRLLSAKCPIWITEMNLWNDSGPKWALETESKQGNWKKTSASWRYVQFSELQHYFPMIPTYTSHKDKVSNLNKIMNLWTDSGRKWALETESKPEIERKHLHHRVMSNSVNYNTSSQWSQHTHLLSTKCPIWIK